MLRRFNQSEWMNSQCIGHVETNYRPIRGPLTTPSVILCIWSLVRRELIYSNDNGGQEVIDSVMHEHYIIKFVTTNLSD